MKTAWEQGRPIFRRLPICGYQDNTPVEWLTRWPDTESCNARLKIDHLRCQVDPRNCDSEWLDWLAQLAGYTGEYWDPVWPDSVKRELIANAYTAVWPNLGTQYCLDFVLDTLEIQHYWNVGILQYELILPTEYQNKPKHRIAELFLRLYGPAISRGVVVFQD